MYLCYCLSLNETRIHKKDLNNKSKMTDLDQLIKSADSLCYNLDKVLEKEKIGIESLRMSLEMYAFEMLCMTNDIKKIKEISEV